MANLRKIETTFVAADDNTDGVYVDSSGALTIRHTTGGPLEPIGGSEQTFTSLAVGDVPLTVKAMAGQTGDLARFYDASNALVVKITAAGVIHGKTGGSVVFDL